MNWYLEVVKKYAVFSGRAHRQEYWMFVLINLIIGFGLGFIEGLVGLPGVLSTLYGLAILLPSLGVSIRRLHDTGRTGWWVLISFVPILGLIVLIVFMVKDSQPGDNMYGPNPRGIMA